MLTLVLCLICLFLGFSAGVLVMRKHHAKLTDSEAKGKALLDVLKGR